jgi:hypothetical protein
MDPVRERRVNVVLVAGGLLIVAAGVVGLVVGIRGAGEADRIQCDDYEFDRTEWLDSGLEDESKERQADALVRCRTLIGRIRKEVTALLGQHLRRGPGLSTHRRWAFSAGEINDYGGPGDALTLFVRFDRDGRVQGARLSQPVKL